MCTQIAPRYLLFAEGNKEAKFVPNSLRHGTSGLYHPDDGVAWLCEVMGEVLD
jgi:hypothetical protein